MARDSEPVQHPVWCPKHKTYYPTDRGCLACKQEQDAGVRPVAQEPPAGDGESQQMMPGGRNRDEVDDAAMAVFLRTSGYAGRIDEMLARGAPSADEIIEECLSIAGFLIDKNKAYGDSALKPVRVMSRADPAEQIRVRMDDKLSRLVRGELAGEDAIKDLVGYYVLLKIAERKEKP